ncbi:flagellar motor switch protein FliM [Liquorilactobacillus mali]|uniref:Flagellar motor switch protein FliM n=1 Tax=Liquorilactobacillus mali KCTC 3596 = DSM 20444 TaxID=1046596 RepID=J0L8K0_9LACO|nr:flagellar motor switch protein FliM [Liquorilactobacillus mali]AJA34084.1 flagellar motor switch protein FliM [Liquorilactobacillus mali KCTC 3596 = DSM 20444]EJF02225.1 flagellar motor switch protein FliM [Liquorilactobacillus mali KCTC 3596 = DSM 20444]KRN11108.1 flagellar motor switch protein FliM [Liquorilactobacillus mali KCTC 3596 = DSM 20444]MDC7953946.1 flagellar motor switch protein FliM [Liquorilactobacillus mali]MDV7757485.1 flagellar motor switch protein FliM [Liquorilactobacill
MDQVLTQQEIDSLLNAMDNGEIVEEEIEKEEELKVKSYDFRRPTKLSKEYVNTLHMIFEDFSKVSSNVLSTLLRSNINFNLASIEQVSYDEFIHSVPRFTLLGLFHSDPLKGIQILEINPQLCTVIVELLCGGVGVGKQDNLSVKGRDSFTDIELTLLKEIVIEMTKIYENVWNDIIELQTEFDELDSNPQLLQNMSPNEPVVMITFTVRIGEVDSFINICVPYVFFEGLTDKLSFHNWFDSNQEYSANDERKLKESLNNIALDLQVVLGESELELSNFLHLEPGDILKLDSKINEPLDSYVEGSPYYSVKLGKKNNQIAVELIDKSEGETQ